MKKATISRLEVDLMKVGTSGTSQMCTRIRIDTLQANKSKTTEVHAAKEAADQFQKKATEFEVKISSLEKQIKELGLTMLKDARGTCHTLSPFSY